MIYTEPCMTAIAQLEVGAPPSVAFNHTVGNELRLKNPFQSGWHVTLTKLRGKPWLENRGDFTRLEFRRAV